MAVHGCLQPNNNAQREQGSGCHSMQGTGEVGLCAEQMLDELFSMRPQAVGQ